ncbi:nucleoside phosphorylase [Porphyromonas circumdentaria]|uniref:Uridine phosphorylase n=1 Tax=Porphyromonas circumdentaria TaxID=29524 RepID=A0A1T4MDL9_9PORP|nr:nucleoside phosphorylase [Porphyromonas circumdentaria]MBB6275806.1 uridine phosphorylase [Porphyromonas circumdentaria]SJZ64975.1 uridine phosphorylase [Porphyromonas circumdentaria]
MEKRIIPPSELIVNSDGSVFHLHLKPEQLSDKILLCGDPDRVGMIASRFESIECDVSNREFRTITGLYKGKRLTIQSHGIGGDNIEIVVNELDILANFDLEKRCVRDEFRQLTMVRIGTSGGIQPEVPIGAYVVAEKTIGFDGVINFYANTRSIRDVEYEKALMQQLDWKIEGLTPYVVTADKELLEQIVGTDEYIVRGSTIACNGFYAPQGRKLRLPLADEELNKKIEDFRYKEFKITNFEMESSALSGMASLLGHKALTICCIIAGRQNLNMNTDYKGSIEGLIDLVLERI